MHWRTRAALFVLLSQENSRDRSGERVSRFPRQEMLLLVSRGSSFPVSKKQVRFLRETKKTVELISTRTNPNFSPLVTCTRGKINWRVFLDPWKRSNNKNTRSTARIRGEKFNSCCCFGFGSRIVVSLPYQFLSVSKSPVLITVRLRNRGRHLETRDAIKKPVAQLVFVHGERKFRFRSDALRAPVYEESRWNCSFNPEKTFICGGGLPMPRTSITRSEVKRPFVRLHMFHTCHNDYVDVPLFLFLFFFFFFPPCSKSNPSV